MSDNNDLLDPTTAVNSNNFNPGILPNSTAVLVLGIVSIVVCGVGLVTGIIALVLHKKDKAIYQTNPQKYEASFKNSKAGNVCAIIGLSLSSLFIFIYVIQMIMLFSVISNIR
jgi:hypothetical protein